MKTENHNTISSGAVWVLVIIVCLVASIGLLVKGQIQREQAYKAKRDSLDAVIKKDSSALLLLYATQKTPHNEDLAAYTVDGEHVFLDSDNIPSEIATRVNLMKINDSTQVLFNADGTRDTLKINGIE